MKYCPALQSLTDALQQLTRDESDPNRKPAPKLPITISSSEMPLPPNIDRFLAQRRADFAEMRNIYPGRDYCFCAV